MAGLCYDTAVMFTACALVYTPVCRYRISEHRSLKSKTGRATERDTRARTHYDIIYTSTIYIQLPAVTAMQHTTLRYYRSARPRTDTFRCNDKLTDGLSESFLPNATALTTAAAVMRGQS